jgi:hypothetical protein
MSEEIKPFDPSIPQEEVDRLFRKLADTRLPQQPIVPDAGEDYGTPTASQPSYHVLLLMHHRPLS